MKVANRKSQIANSHLLVAVANRQSRLRIDKRRLRQAVKQVLAGEGRCRARISVAVVDNAAIHDLNRRFLQHDEPTDVLSFPLGDGGDEAILEGELVISAEMANEVAGRFGWSSGDELLLYAIHGSLHLLGYDDLTEDAADRMREKEKHYLAALGIQIGQ